MRPAAALAERLGLPVGESDLIEQALVHTSWLHEHPDDPVGHNERLKKLVVEQLGVEEDEVKPEASFVDDLNADSLDLVEAVLALEEEWDIEIPEDEMEQIKTVGAAVDMVATKLGVS